MAGLTVKEQEALNLFTKLVLEEFASEPGFIQSIQLFGSKARGDADKHSDIDVLVIMKDRSSDNRMRVSGAVSDVILKTGVVISAKKFTPEQITHMRDRNSMFWQSISPDLVPLHGST